MEELQMNTKRMLAGVATFAIAATAIVGFTTGAVAAPGDPVAGNITPFNGSRVVAYPGAALAKNAVKTHQIAGATFGSQSVPANATGVAIDITSTASTSDGALLVYPSNVSKPGVGTVYFDSGERVTESAIVQLSPDGKLNVSTTATGQVYTLTVTSYITPVAAPAPPVVKTIAKKAFTPIKVGGGFVARNTDMGEVTLEPGTYDARVMAQFQGFNQTTDPTKPGYNTVPADVKLTGTVVISLGDTVNPDFSNNISVGGIVVQDSASSTLTVETTGGPNTIFTITAATDVHVRVFAAASDSSQAGSDQLKVALDSAVFRKL
jgi:hypothetical protein